MTDQELERRAALAKADQIAEMARLEAAGDTFAAYWAGSASASLGHHRRRKAVRFIRA
jgi:hypothetical protein